VRPLEAIPREEAAAITTLLFDLDDTVLSHGRLTRAAYDAMWDLADAGFDLAAATGRPAGWGEVVARQWPLLGVVAENGAVLLHVEGGGIVRSLRGSVASRGVDRTKLAAIIEEVRSAVGLELADDNAARLTDVTFDVGERVTAPREAVDEARAIIASHGGRSLVSSVHLHATFEGDDKASGALRLLGERRGLDAGTARVKVAFVGDSGNDAACFAYFRTTIGVANVAPWAPRMTLPPRWITRGARGDGFAELAKVLISERRP
jgi:HAD superfamily hydrolase (TIGR01484 family)